MYFCAIWCTLRAAGSAFALELLRVLLNLWAQGRSARDEKRLGAQSAVTGRPYITELWSAARLATEGFHSVFDDESNIRVQLK